MTWEYPNSSTFGSPKSQQAGVFVPAGIALTVILLLERDLLPGGQRPVGLPSITLESRRLSPTRIITQPTWEWLPYRAPLSMRVAHSFENISPRCTSELRCNYVWNLLDNLGYQPLNKEVYQWPTARNVQTLANLYQTSVSSVSAADGPAFRTRYRAVFSGPGYGCLSPMQPCGCMLLNIKISTQRQVLIWKWRLIIPQTDQCLVGVINHIISSKQ